MEAERQNRKSLLNTDTKSVETYQEGGNESC